MPRRVVVFIDYENMHRCAASAFQTANGHFWPWDLGERIVAIRNAHDSNSPSELHQVRVYRGLPDARLQPTSNAANQAQTAAWVRAAAAEPDRLVIYQRPLRYPYNWPNGDERPQEKGVDVALAVHLVQMTYQGGLDVAVVCSHDSDLAPALDVVASATTSSAHLEVASWDRQKRISFSNDASKPWCHRLGQGDFEAVKDTTVYKPST